MNDKLAIKGKRHARTAAATTRLALWTAAWLITYALATFGAERLKEVSVVLVVGLIVINAALGVGMMLATRTHWLQMDEMWQRIHTDAMVITLAAGFVGGFSYVLLDTTNLISSSASISFLMIPLGLIYMGSIVYKGSRYR